MAFKKGIREGGLIQLIEEVRINSFNIYVEQDTTMMSEIEFKPDIENSGLDESFFKGAF